MGIKWDFRMLESICNVIHFLYLALGQNNIEYSSNYQQICGHVHMQTRLDAKKNKKLKKKPQIDIDKDLKKGELWSAMNNQISAIDKLIS